MMKAVRVFVVLICVSGLALRKIQILVRFAFGHRCFGRGHRRSHGNHNQPRYRHQ